MMKRKKYGKGGRPVRPTKTTTERGMMQVGQATKGSPTKPPKTCEKKYRGRKKGISYD